MKDSTEQQDMPKRRAETPIAPAADLPSDDALARVRIENVQPEVDAGRWPAKCVLGDSFAVQVDLIADGHDLVAGALLFRGLGDEVWNETPLKLLVNDRFEAEFVPTRLGRWEFTVLAWVDEFATWRRALEKKAAAGQDVRVELTLGAELVEAAARRAPSEDRSALMTRAKRLGSPALPPAERTKAALDEVLLGLMSLYPERSRASRHARALQVRVERERARFSAWYELFPRSWGKPGEHGTFKELEQRLAYVAKLGFDVVYLPPIHPIGVAHRKGRDNTLKALEDDPGSPWAIGSPEGGHKAVHPELGSLEDFRSLLRSAEKQGLEVAIDIALQTSPDHPYVTEHPGWYRHRPDGTIQYAENPPKKYQDIYPFDFECEDWKALWAELTSVFLFWAEQGVRIFRVDNPHTKPLRFWEWCLGRLHTEYPDVILLSEAFTRPKLMYVLAKAGFTQSYTYFTWRTTKAELTEYLEELTALPVASFFRPNFWPNTPDILPEHLQHGGRPTFITRLVLAATLSGNYGIYGPAYELMERTARPGSGEYADNEKYEIKHWSLADPDSLGPILQRINRIRRQNPALQQTNELRFHPVENEQLLCFSKQDAGRTNQIVVVVNLDEFWRQSGWLELDLEYLGLEADETFQVHDLISDARYRWKGRRNFVELDPNTMPAHVLHIERFVRRENDFDYYA